MHYTAIVLAACALAGAGATLAAPDEPGAASRPQSSNAAETQAATTTSPAQQRSLRSGEPDLVSAEELVGRAVRTADGETVGTIKHLTIDVADRGVSQLIVDTSGTAFAASGGSARQDGAEEPGQAGTPARTAADTDPTESSNRTVIGSEPATQQNTGAMGGTAADRDQSAAAQHTASAGSLMILPWSVVQVEGEQIRTSAGSPQISQAPRLQADDLNQLSEPALVAYVVDYWAPASELAAFESQQRSSASQSPGTEQQDGRAQGSDADRGATPPAAGDQQVMVLVGQGVATQVMPPMFHMSEQLRGATVQNRQGERLGEIRRIIIDQRNGHGAYAVVEQRAGGSPAAVPLPALQWSARGTTTLTASSDDLQANTALTEDPGQVRRAELAALYQRFDVQPYWEPQGAGAQQQ